LKKYFTMKQSLFSTCLFLLSVTLAAQNPTLPGGFAQTIRADSLNPTAMVFDHHGNLYLSQKDGRVLLLPHDGNLLPDPVLQIPVDDFNERGMAGIALHPDFDQQPWLYVFYTVRDSNYNRVSRFLLNGNVAVPGSEQIIFEFDKLNSGIHNGGSLLFGKDGKLYIGTGDGGKSSNSQLLSVTLGKILRLNDDGSIPADNPFYLELTGKNRALYAYGLRNPFSMAMQPGSGAIFVSEVGQGAFEEVNEIRPHKNYGWSQIEGPVSTQTIPPDYQDPFFAYPHANGCAIVGAAIYEPEAISFPAAYVGKYFFADYCSGVVKLLDLSSGLASDTFATGLKQPVAFAINPHDGSLWYLMRSGIGGGSITDNTSSSDGTLWNVFYTGSGAPFISVPPQDILLPIGENARFAIQVLGAVPFHFQWQKDGVDLPGANTANLEYPAVSLADNTARFRCIVTNLSGSDTSDAAILSVTANQRPQPQILMPALGGTYKAGDVIHFQGMALDPEDGTLPAANLRWRVDFHHDSHVHPALATTPGISEGYFAVPIAGETSSNTWYRIYLTATDQSGLEQTVWREVFPALTSVRVMGPIDLPVNVDGVIRPMPYNFQSLMHQQHIAQALDQFILRDTIFIFEKWAESSDNQRLFTFTAPDTPGLVLHPIYSAYTLGNGTGLHGEYFIDPEFDLDEDPAVLRLDTVINFDWGSTSPFPNQLPNNGYTVRWSGFVQPYFTEEYTFHVKSDDGCRLWIGDTLLIDKWVAQASIQHSGTIRVEGGAKIPIRLEYLEISGGADISLHWSSARTPKALVPKRQLYPIPPYEPATLRGTVWHDLDYNQLIDSGEPLLKNTTVLLYDGTDSTLLATGLSDAQGRYKFSGLEDGTYFLRFVPAAADIGLLPRAHLDAAGQTERLTLGNLQSLLWNVSFVTPAETIAGLVWLDENANYFPDLDESGLEAVTVLLYTADSALVDAQTTNENGQYQFEPVMPGIYFLFVLTNALPQPLEPTFGLNSVGQTPIFDVRENESRVVDLGFKPKKRDGFGPVSAHDLKIKPNPVRETLTFQWLSTVESVLQIQVADVMGRSWPVIPTQHATNNTWEMDVHTLPAGIYFLQIELATQRIAKRFVKY
jgi:glucose/arabinose dehydrogenase